jgi:rRNA maturation RNase YbeY
METKVITFHFQHPTFQLKERTAIRQWLNACVTKSGEHIAELNYQFCTDSFMHEANKQFLSHDYLTDILTFETRSTHGISGDILISIDRVRDNARSHKTRVRDELHRVMAHGALHLLGYPDKSALEAKAMRTREDQWLHWRSF